MHSFSYLSYFDLSGFAHACLFDASEPVWMALKTIREYLKSAPLGKIEGFVDPRAYLIHPELISIGKGSIIEPGAYIAGPCIIGENCQVRHGAYLRGEIITGNNCVIGHATEIKNTVFLNHSNAGHFAYIGDSIVGSHVNLGAGTKCANLRFDNQNVRIAIQGDFIDSGLRKFGAVLGDFTQTGCNSVTNPGTLMGKNSRLSPCVAAHGVIPDQTIIKSNEFKYSNFL